MITTFDNVETTILAPQDQRFGNAHPIEILLTPGYVREVAEALQELRARCKAPTVNIRVEGCPAHFRPFPCCWGRVSERACYGAPLHPELGSERFYSCFSLLKQEDNACNLPGPMRATGSFSLPRVETWRPWLELS